TTVLLRRPASSRIPSSLITGSPFGRRRQAAMLRRAGRRPSRRRGQAGTVGTTAAAGGRGKRDGRDQGQSGDPGPRVGGGQAQRGVEDRLGGEAQLAGFVAA